MGPELDEEMEKVFAMDTAEKFDVARLGSPSESTGSDRDRDRGPPRYGDRDVNRKLSLFYYFYISVYLYFSIFHFWNRLSLKSKTIKNR